eukprot:CAMPEP_0173180006 /NCGR_PEP_ID=MMETSP1141-20130122/6459_1 /TAXON_ID=483371 /ORGANISM="non described non described, Strain CCMP2298" /LENGTH=161 /DNA_ID=CAMNT_0014102775 /DNA_START=27 /DNA_END=509 /DNA_ORIENTATION=-
MSVYPCIDAMCRGVSPSCPLALMAAPFSSSSRAISECPFADASCRDAKPCLPFSLIKPATLPADPLSSVRTTPTSPLQAAVCSLSADNISLTEEMVWRTGVPSRSRSAAVSAAAAFLSAATSARRTCDALRSERSVLDCGKQRLKMQMKSRGSLEDKVRIS